VYPLLFVENCSLIDQFRKYELATELRDSAKLSLRSLYKAVEQIDPSLCTCDCLNGLNEELNHWDRPYKLAHWHLSMLYLEMKSCVYYGVVVK
jgi:hypothetical protein